MTKFEAQMLVTETLRQLGLTSGEITERQAKRTYGKPFTDAVAAGKIKPVRIGYGKTATKHYRVLDILDWQNECYKPATII
jgi:hypothetical protein